MARWVIGVDVGGTFTDFAARETSSGVSIVHKRLSTPDDPSRAILLGLQELQQKAGILDKDIDRIAHGTTVATNALLQRKGARVAVATTAGFRDLLEIGRQVRPLIYDLQVDAPAALADRHNRLEVRERIAAFSGYDLSMLEPLQVVRYHPGEKYESHHDSFDLCDFAQRPRRHLTFLIYLNDLPGGGAGHTAFPRLNLQLEPKARAALVFNDVLDNG
mgnify:CR=1 FL=1